MRSQENHEISTVRKQIVLSDEDIKLVDGDGIVSCRWHIGNKRDLHIFSTITDGVCTIKLSVCSTEN